jgi:hypothetical protein
MDCCHLQGSWEQAATSGEAAVGLCAGSVVSHGNDQPATLCDVFQLAIDSNTNGVLTAAIRGR